MNLQGIIMVQSIARKRSLRWYRKAFHEEGLPYDNMGFIRIFTSTKTNGFLGHIHPKRKRIAVTFYALQLCHQV